jgi:hypothetical protein
MHSRASVSVDTHVHGHLQLTRAPGAAMHRVHGEKYPSNGAIKKYAGYMWFAYTSEWLSLRAFRRKEADRKHAYPHGQGQGQGHGYRQGQEFIDAQQQAQHQLHQDQIQQQQQQMLQMSLNGHNDLDHHIEDLHMEQQIYEEQEQEQEQEQEHEHEHEQVQEQEQVERQKSDEEPGMDMEQKHNDEFTHDEKQTQEIESVVVSTQHQNSRITTRMAWIFCCCVIVSWTRHSLTRASQCTTRSGSSHEKNTFPPCLARQATRHCSSWVRGVCARL